MNNIWKITGKQTTEHRQTAYKVKTVLKTMEKSLKMDTRKQKRDKNSRKIWKRTIKESSLVGGTNGQWKTDNGKWIKFSKKYGNGQLKKAVQWENRETWPK